MLGGDVAYMALASKHERETEAAPYPMVVKVKDDSCIEHTTGRRELGNMDALWWPGRERKRAERRNRHWHREPRRYARASYTTMGIPEALQGLGRPPVTLLPCRWCSSEAQSAMAPERPTGTRAFSGSPGCWKA